MEENLEDIRKTLKKYSQEHLLNEYERLDDKEGVDPCDNM